MSTQNVISAGNGKSLASIDYARLPAKYAVYRCNLFYFEDQYFLGKKIDRAFFTPRLFVEQFYTAQQLQRRGEYQIAEILMASFHSPLVELERTEQLKKLFSDAIDGYPKTLKKLEKFDLYIRSLELLDAKRITTGVYMAAAAVAAGAENIYIAGIDLFLNPESRYAFAYKKENIVKLNPDFVQPHTSASHHTPETDIAALRFLADTYGVNFYVLSEDSPLTAHFPLAPVTGSSSILQTKPENAIKDILTPPRYVYEKLEGLDSFPPPRPQRRNLHNNTVYNAGKDLLRLPKQLYRYLAERKALKKNHP